MQQGGWVACTLKLYLSVLPKEAMRSSIKLKVWDGIYKRYLREITRLTESKKLWILLNSLLSDDRVTCKAVFITASGNSFSVPQSVQVKCKWTFSSGEKSWSAVKLYNFCNADFLHYIHPFLKVMWIFSVNSRLHWQMSQWRQPFLDMWKMLFYVYAQMWCIALI